MYVYMLRCADNSLYTGITNDILRRFRQHSGKLGGGAKYTRSRRAVSVCAVWKTDSESAARKAEYAIKRLNKAQKENLIRNPECIREYCALNGIKAETAVRNPY